MSREDGNAVEFVERRRPQPIQRDWLGHMIMFSGTVAVIVIAVAGSWWGMVSSNAATTTKLDAISSQVTALQALQTTVNTLQTTAATLGDRENRDERDIADLRGSFLTTTTTMDNISNQLAVFNEKLKQLVPERRR